MTKFLCSIDVLIKMHTPSLPNFGTIVHISRTSVISDDVILRTIQNQAVGITRLEPRFTHSDNVIKSDVKYIVQVIQFVTQAQSIEIIVVQEIRWAGLPRKRSLTSHGAGIDRTWRHSNNNSIRVMW